MHPPIPPWSCTMNISCLAQLVKHLSYFTVSLPIPRCLPLAPVWVSTPSPFLVWISPPFGFLLPPLVWESVPLSSLGICPTLKVGFLPSLLFDSPHIWVLPSSPQFGFMSLPLLRFTLFAPPPPLFFQVLS